ncbi:hypothetical protein Y032_0140g2165 [Ancylostoma ceylanicum]|uniref:Uncharacterized protein n=1 Tax=Ancylostoma ceylanicum TaxID=53326 RepID=A0A016T4G0_9BILA|nr:hypothetical protein Y032_0140g2165 [Ancylostoma ceylanicum]
MHHRFEGGDMWLQPPPRPPPPMMYPGLGGVPRHPAINYLYDEGRPFPNRGGGANTDLVIKCPECRQPTKVPPEGLSVNYRLQELVARVSETNPPTNSAADSGDSDGNRLPKCLVCDEVMAKGVYLSCRTCFAENEAVRQLCSMCCLRNHNGHEIEEKRFLTMNDIVIGRESVSEATGRGFQAVDQAAHELDACAASAKDFFQQSTQNVLRAFEIIANDMQFEILSCHDELERKVTIAQEISAKLEQLPDIVKTILEEFRSKLDAAMNHFVNSTLVYEGLHASSLQAEGLPRNRELEGESCGASNQVGTSSCTDSERRDGQNSSRCGDVRDVPRALSLLERRTRQLRMMQQQCNSLRRRRLQDRLNRHHTYNRDLWSLDADRERHERLREELRNDLFDTDDRGSRDHSNRRQCPVHPCRQIPPTCPSTMSTPTRSQAGEERVRSNSVEIISSTPPAVVDLEQRAERLIITPERRVPKTEAGAEDDARDNGSGSVGVKN